MLDEDKVKLMTKLAFYEQTEGKEDFKISEYYRRDYASLHMLCSFLWVTIGYCCIGVLIVIAGLETLLDKMSMGILITLIIAVVVGYVVLLIVFGIITSHIYNKKHKDARYRVKLYNHNLIKLLKLYEKENK